MDIRVHTFFAVSFKPVSFFVLDMMLRVYGLWFLQVQGRRYVFNTSSTSYYILFRDLAAWPEPKTPPGARALECPEGLVCSRNLHFIDVQERGENAEGGFLVLVARPLVVV